MKHTLVGYTGFVGGNLARSHSFDNLYNSKNIAQAFGADNGLVVYSGMPAEKFLANADPAADLAVARQAFDNIQAMKPRQLVHISTVDVYPSPAGVYEDTPVDGGTAPAYGKNRLALEGWVRQAYPGALIVRLPGLYGAGIKKNFIFDMFTLTPSALTAEKYAQLAQKQPLVRHSYAEDGKGFYRLVPMDAEQTAALKAFFRGNDFNALRFTDSRSTYQFYGLSRLWQDIAACLNEGLTLVNLATQPVAAGALYQALFGRPFEDLLEKPPAHYDMRTRHAATLGGSGDYLADAGAVVEDIKAFVRQAFGYTGEGGL